MSNRICNTRSDRVASPSVDLSHAMIIPIKLLGYQGQLSQGTDGGFHDGTAPSTRNWPIQDTQPAAL